MRIAWQLPTAFPDLYWLTRHVHSDIMLLNDMQPFNRKSRVHRGKIRNTQGFQWIYMPIHPDDRKKPLHKARVDTTTDWLTPLLRALEFAYRNSIYYDFYEPEIQQDFSVAAGMHRYLDAVEHLNSRLWEYLEMDDICETVYLSKLSSHSNMAPFHLHLPPDTSKIDLLPEFSSSNYLQKRPFNHLLEENVLPAGVPVNEMDPAVVISSYHPIYRQHFGGFIQGCCLYDILFEVGPEFWRTFENIRSLR